MITMEYANDFHELYDFFIKDYNKLIQSEEGKEVLYNIYAYIFSLLLTMYICTGVIHGDLHDGNIMIHTDVDENFNPKNNVYLIDYGIILNSENEWMEDLEEFKSLFNSSMDERYLEFSVGIHDKSYKSNKYVDISYKKVVKFFKRKYSYFITFIREPHSFPFNIFSVGIFENELFIDYFKKYISNILYNVDTSIKKLEIIDNDKIIVDSYNINVITAKEKAANKIKSVIRKCILRRKTIKSNRPKTTSNSAKSNRPKTTSNSAKSNRS